MVGQALPPLLLFGFIVKIVFFVLGGLRINNVNNQSARPEPVEVCRSWFDNLTTTGGCRMHLFNLFVRRPLVFQESKNAIAILGARKD